MNDQDGNRRKPLYQQTEEALQGMLAGMEPGSFLPSEPRLAKQLGVSRATLREAMRGFEERGLIVRRQGVGTRVTRPPQILDSGLEVLESVPSLAQRADLAVEVDALELHERTLSAEEAEHYEFAPAQVVVEVRRVLMTVERPVAYLVDTVPKEILPREVHTPDFRGSVLDLFLEYGPPLSHSRTNISAVSADAATARRLRIQRGEVLMLLEAWLCAHNGSVVDHSMSYFLPGIFRFHIVRKIKQQ
jgi:GntR family transcriptional regulator